MQKEDFDEEELFGELDNDQALDSFSRDEEDDACGESEAVNSSSVKSSATYNPNSLKAIVEDGQIDIDSNLASAYISRGRPLIPFSLPSNMGVRMGSSVPIAMPMVPKKRKEEQADNSSDDEDDGAHVSNARYQGTFIPPHELSHRQENFMSVVGGASLMKRERLKARNAILKATGFVENHTQPVTIQDGSKFQALTSGGLTQSLALFNGV
ncbi:hypothetical protein CEUSTIGMA_g1349.t1 [Chlamydomonas eustigma]|uniref:Uncharacterized protein n=1 Tax=Chlamydomonas eustigma TaxID=1157962 RepID=A0A250WT52_9CHLO|nr:hypothetical protein CEUSTIGMA_g1349.t1 [Chlamydomonas eustigma]|eukprot:GAX73899.1 hypothetical protein CEUSTIGMA_g1349.t1 [Chlamydomonas eustigma]